jgi:hypothetical protein
MKTIVRLLALPLLVSACTSPPGGDGEGEGEAAEGEGEGEASEGEGEGEGEGEAQVGYFPSGAWMYQSVADAPLAANSAAMTQWLADNGSWGTGQLRVDFSFDILHVDADTPYLERGAGEFYDPDCDDVAMPVPVGGAIEGVDGYQCSNADCHLLVVDDRDQRLYEAYNANVDDAGVFTALCIAAWDMTRVYGPEGRGEQCTSSDAAGFPIAPLLLTADEVASGVVNHAIRLILPNERMRAGVYVHPATHAGAPSADDVNAPPYGTRWRLRADYPLDTLPSEGARVVARALQTYGMALSDGGNIALTATGDRFSEHTWQEVGFDTRSLVDLQPTDFEVIATDDPIDLTYDCVRSAY